jgi:hypothetical protein
VALQKSILVGAQRWRLHEEASATHQAAVLLLLRWWCAEISCPSGKEHHALVDFCNKAPAVILFNVSLDGFETAWVGKVGGDGEADKVDAATQERVGPSFAHHKAHQSEREPQQKKDEVHRQNEEDRALGRTNQGGKGTPEVVGQGV